MHAYDDSSRSVHGYNRLTMAASRRRLGGWGFEGQTFEPSQQLLAWLEQRIGPARHSVPERAAAPPDVSAADVGLLPAEVSHDPCDCLAHARGQGLADVLRLRGGLVPAGREVCACREAVAVREKVVFVVM